MESDIYEKKEKIIRELSNVKRLIDDLVIKLDRCENDYEIYILLKLHEQDFKNALNVKNE